MRPLVKSRAVGVVAAIAWFALSVAGATAGAAPRSLPLERQTARDVTVLTRTSYNYAPAMIRDEGIYHLYWCGGVAGDYILHVSGPSPTGPWTPSGSPDIALRPTGNAADFDGLHTCDPNVIKLGSTFYLYYSGLAKDGALTAVGVATSPDGVHFTRGAGGKAIVTAAKTDADYVARHLVYGAGQPAVVSVPPYLYISFTDSTGAGANPFNGAGQFVLRSRDPLFRTGIEELTAGGWQARRAGEHDATFSYAQSFGLDLGYDRSSKTIVAVTDRVAGQASILALDPVTFSTIASGDIAIDWREGPGLVTEADKTLAPRAACAALPIGVLAPEGASADPFSWHRIGYSAGIVSMAAVCGGSP